MLLVLACQLPPAWAGLMPPSVALHDGSDSRRELAALADLVAPPLRRGSTVLAIVPERSAELRVSRLRALRSAYDTTRLVVHTTHLPPLATMVLVRTIGELSLSDRFPPGLLASTVTQIERQITGAAWLGSVSKLRYPNPTVRMHARSWLPRSRFAAIVDHDPQVMSLRADELLPIARLQPPGDWRVVLSDGDGDLDTVQRTLSEQAPGAEVVRIPATPESAAWWGTEKLVEFAYLPRRIERYVPDLVGAPTASTCRWCAEHVALDPCPLCGSMVAPPGLTDGAA